MAVHIPLGATLANSCDIHCTLFTTGVAIHRFAVDHDDSTWWEGTANDETQSLTIDLGEQQVDFSRLTDPRYIQLSL